TDTATDTTADTTTADAATARCPAACCGRAAGPDTAPADRCTTATGGTAAGPTAATPHAATHHRRHHHRRAAGTLAAGALTVGVEQCLVDVDVVQQVVLRPDALGAGERDALLVVLIVAHHRPLVDAMFSARTRISSSRVAISIPSLPYSPGSKTGSWNVA